MSEIYGQLSCSLLNRYKRNYIINEPGNLSIGNGVVWNLNDNCAEKLSVNKVMCQYSI